MGKYLFLDNEGTFEISRPENTNYLYFPLAGMAGLKSVVTPNLNGDAKLDQESFLYEPVSSENLHNNRSSRNFWVIADGKEIWSATGQSAEAELAKGTEEQEESKMQAGLLFTKLFRTSERHRLSSEITMFVPVSENVELFRVKITNTAERSRKIAMVTGLPIYGRSADNIRDHRNVTSMLHRISVTEHGVVVTPTMSFDEKGHRRNHRSCFVAFQYFYAMTIMKIFAIEKKDTAYADSLTKERESFGKLLNEQCWDEDRFIRGFTEAGERIGEKKAPEANMWLNPQSWSVISGLADETQANLAMENVSRQLNTKYGAILMDPPYHAHAFDGALAVIYNAGTKENAGVFSQSQGWLILAEALMGHGNRAFMYFSENAPSMQNDRAEIRQLEPYCYGQFTEGKASKHFGRSHVHWLTGTASTVMVGCVEGILGMRPTLDGLRITPSVPSDWEQFEIEKDFRGKHLHIVVKNPGHAESGCKKLVLNGNDIQNDFIDAKLLSPYNEVELWMS